METRTVQIQKRRDGVTMQPWAHLRLPAFPPVAIRVMQLANSEVVQLRQLSDLISSDAAFASEVLTVANSLLYAPRFPAQSILQAIAVLGATNLQGLCLTVGVRTYLGKTLNIPSMRDLWRHNLACAFIAEQLAATGFIDKDVAYTCGMLHDMAAWPWPYCDPTSTEPCCAPTTGLPAASCKARRTCSDGTTAKLEGN
jgi:hypothetical protein